MEEILKQLLCEVKSLREGQNQLFEGQKQLFDGQKQLFDGQKQLFEGQNQLFDGQNQLFDGQKQLFDGQNQLTARLDRIESTMATKEELEKVSQSVARIENDHGNKISALFDGYTLRGDQIERLREHLDERLDSIQTDLSYVVSKVAQHDRNIVKLNKIAK